MANLKECKLNLLEKGEDWKILEINKLEKFKNQNRLLDRLKMKWIGVNKSIKI